MDDKEMAKLFDATVDRWKERSLAMNSAVVGSLVQFQKNIQNSLEGRLRQLVNSKHPTDATRALALLENESVIGLMKASFEKQLEAWKVNPFWVDQPPEIKVSVPKGSLCNLNAKFNVGLPPESVFNIVTDPDNKRVFKNIKEVSSRKVLLDEGLRQVVEVEQAAIWRFLLWSGTITVNLIVDQNRKDYTVKFKQGKSGFMKRFEGCWKIEPLFVDEQMCRPYKPRMWSDYDSCTQGKGRVGSVVSLDQLIQPALMPPPPISWYLRGITIRTTEMLVKDLFVEAARLRCTMNSEGDKGDLEGSVHHSMLDSGYGFVDMKQRWHVRRKENRRRNRRLLLAH
ncbi:uncharacterized protein LOC122000383 [Zingiber officinale]|uniref:uncharacterized protein LOC122000383 n=1 Tax=Zingiber officinale TaxID=94328 RepID=UPI001C4B79CB|nr:uncharacterized protein LOC122000383 [Zingiber officinale]XP_042410728.1 uncharacterized protein LOC122000383 [Zingiber officinale]XP_042410730.1 uncharacterized protein LOC122000383 [Zingiber officinale]